MGGGGIAAAGAFGAASGGTGMGSLAGLLRARGLDTAAVAARLGLSVHTVRRHTEHLMAKRDLPPNHLLLRNNPRNSIAEVDAIDPIRG